jgi:hypothetical protein
MVVTGFILGYKGRSAWWAMLLSLLLGPVGIIAALFVPAAKSTGSKGWKKCPWCGEVIRRQAVVCKHCGREVGSGSGGKV